MSLMTKAVNIKNYSRVKVQGVPMFHVCPNCGEYAVEKRIDPSGPFAICPHCKYAHPFLQQPLFILTGASGTGKSTVCLFLISILNECVVLEQDILWGMVPATSDNHYSGYRNVWLRIAKNIGQAGRPVVLCGTALPEQFEGCP
jgi:ribosomal protein L32